MENEERGWLLMKADFVFFFFFFIKADLLK